MNSISVWSFSRLSAFDTCPYQYYLSYLANPKPINEENSFNQYGLFVHEILEKYFKNEIELFELVDYYESQFDESVTIEFPYCEVKGKPYDLGQKYYDDGLAFLSNFEGLEGYKILGVEEDFTVDFLDGERLHGFIDLILEDRHGQIVILDHKSKSGFKNKTEEKHYSFQPILYSLHIFQKYGRWPDRVVFNMFRKQEYVKIKFTQEGLREALDWANSTIKSINSCTDFLPKFSKKEKEAMMYFCNNICGFKSSCAHKFDYIEAGEVKTLGCN